MDPKLQSITSAELVTAFRLQALDLGADLSEFGVPNIDQQNRINQGRAALEALQAELVRRLARAETDRRFAAGIVEGLDDLEGPMVELGDRVKAAQATHDWRDRPELAELVAGGESFIRFETVIDANHPTGDVEVLGRKLDCGCTLVEYRGRLRDKPPELRLHCPTHGNPRELEGKDG